MIIEINKDIREYCCFAIIVFGVLKYSNETNYYVGTICSLSLSLIIVGLSMAEDFQRYKKYLFIMLISIILGMMNIVIVGQMSIIRIVNISLIYLPVAMFICEEMFLSLNKPWMLLLIIGMIWCVYRYNEYGWQTFFRANRNHVSTLLFVLIFFAAFCRETNHKVLPFAFYAVFFACCIYSVGRMSILSSGLLLALVGFKKYVNVEKSNPRNRYILLVLIALVLIISSIYVWDRRFQIVSTYFSRFTEIQGDSFRMSIIQDYIKHLNNFKSILFGRRTMDIVNADTHEGNLHNAYLMTHSTFGIIGIVFPVVGAILGPIKLWKLGYKESSLVLLCFFVRSFSDDIWGTSMGSCCMWIGVLYAMKYIEPRSFELSEYNG